MNSDRRDSLTFAASSTFRIVSQQPESPLYFGNQERWTRQPTPTSERSKTGCVENGLRFTRSSMVVSQERLVDECKNRGGDFKAENDKPDSAPSRRGEVQQQRCASLRLNFPTITFARGSMRFALIPSRLL